MFFTEVLGQEHIKKHLIYTADTGRVAHAQLFVGPEGSGTLPMALAYANYLLCGPAPEQNITEHAQCSAKCYELTHPDLHMVFPLANPSSKSSTTLVSDDLIKEWRQFIKEQPYGNLYDWYRLLGIEKKQGQISVAEAKTIVKKLSYKAFEGGRKVMLLWMAEKMNNEAANKLLKLIEEPPADTVLILIAENEEGVINTIRSRCQILHFPALQEPIIAQKLMEEGVNETKARQLAHEANGNYNKAHDLAHNDSEDLTFEKWFVQWVRGAFKAKGNKGAIHELLAWSQEIAGQGRETQKNFLAYCMATVRQALLLNYQMEPLVYAKMHTDNFQLEKFAPFVHENNILQLTEELELAMYHIERNGNAKLIFTDLSIKLTRLLHSKAN